MNDRKIIALDLDGTILPHETYLPDRTRDCLRECQNMGHTVLLTSARHWEMSRWVYDAIGIKGPGCFLNGAHVLDPYDDSFAPLELTMDRETSAAILKEIMANVKLTKGYIEYNNRCWSLGDKHSKYYAERIEHSIAGRFSADNIPDTKVSKFQLFAKTEEEINRIAEIVSHYDGINIAITQNKSDFRCSVLRKDVDKWNGILYVAKILGVSLDNIYAFGDQWNDVTMTANAAHGYGMLGSLAAKTSRFVTRLSCEEFGVADVLEKEILNKN